MNINKNITTTLAILALSSSLQGCIFVAGAAAGAAGIAAVYDHRKVVNTIEDTTITNQIYQRIVSIPHLRQECHIEVTVFNHVVLLTGQTPNPAWRQEVEAIARSTADVTKIYNQITVQGPTSSLTRTSDSWITTKVKSLMLANQDLKSGNIKIETENGVVYLMGIVNRDQACIAADIAREVTGVQRVVKMFQYTN